jgi:hypothetical protein
MSKSPQTIDDRILSKIPGFGHDDDTDTTPNDQANEGETDESQSSESESQEGDVATAVNVRKGDSQGSDDQRDASRDGKHSKGAKEAPVLDPKTGKPIQQQQAQFADPITHKGNWRVDAKGNVINREGHIVAKAGNERRLFEKGRALEGRLQVAQRETQGMQAALKKLTDAAADAKVLEGQPRALGLSAEESYMGLRLVSMYKKDAGEFFRYVVAQMTKAGHDVSKLTGNGGAVVSPDPAAIQDLIRREISTALGPITQTRQRADEDARTNDEVMQQTQAFFNNHVDAEIHEEVLARMLAADDNLSLDAAYWKLKAFAADNGFNFDEPLQAQVDAARNANGNGQPRGQQQQGRRPMPAGRGGAVPVTRNEPKFSHDSSWDDIIRTTMRENKVGIQ